MKKVSIIIICGLKGISIIIILSYLSIIMISLLGKNLLKSRQFVAGNQSVLSSKTSLVNSTKRFFDLHEFQSKYIMGQFGVNV